MRLRLFFLGFFCVTSSSFAMSPRQICDLVLGGREISDLHSLDDRTYSWIELIEREVKQSGTVDPHLNDLTKAYPILTVHLTEEGSEPLRRVRRLIRFEFLQSLGEFYPHSSVSPRKRSFVSPSVRDQKISFILPTLDLPLSVETAHHLYWILRSPESMLVQSPELIHWVDELGLSISQLERSYGVYQKLHPSFLEIQAWTSAGRSWEGESLEVSSLLDEVDPETSGEEENFRARLFMSQVHFYLGQKAQEMGPHYWKGFEVLNKKIRLGTVSNDRYESSFQKFAQGLFQKIRNGENRAVAQLLDQALFRYPSFWRKPLNSSDYLSTPLVVAARFGNLEAIQMIKRFPKTALDRYLIHLASGKGKIVQAELQFLLSVYGERVLKTQDHRGRNLLQIALQNPSSEMTEVLLESGLFESEKAKSF